MARYGERKTQEERQHIVAEWRALGGGEKAAMRIGQRHGVSAQSLYRWAKQEISR